MENHITKGLKRKKRKTERWINYENDEIKQYKVGLSNWCYEGDFI